MALPAGLIQLMLVGLSLFSIYGTWGLFGGNGTMEISADYKKAGMLPGTTVPFRSVYTGIPQFDGFLVTVNSFFWQVLDGSHPTYALHSFRFGGQVIALWSLVMLDGMRQGKKGRINSYVLLYGLAFQGVAVGNVNPIFLALGLFNTAMASPSLNQALPSDPVEAFTIPISIITGYVLPLIAMTLPAPYFWSYSSQQAAMGVWQVFPLWTTLSQQLFKILLPRSSSTNVKAKTALSIRALKVIYIFSFLSAFATQIATWTICLTATLFPTLFHPTYASAFAPSKVFLPAAITTAVKMKSVGAGAGLFLQYDEIFGCSSQVLYLGWLFSQKWTPRGLGQWMRTVLEAAAILAVAGPAGLAVVLAWARDEVLFAEEREGKKVQ